MVSSKWFSLSYKHQLVGLHNEGCCEAENELVQRSAAFEPGATSCEICGGQNGAVSGFSRTLWFSRGSFILPSIPPSVTFHLCSTLIILTPLLSKGQAGENSESSKQISSYRGTMARNVKQISYRGTMARNVKQISSYRETMARKLSKSLSYREHWPETYLHYDFLFSEALRGCMGCKIKWDLGLHGLLLILALILWVRQHIYFNHTRIHKQNVLKRRYSNGWKTRVCTQIQISSQSSTEHRTELNCRTSTRTEG